MTNDMLQGTRSTVDAIAADLVAIGREVSPTTASRTMSLLAPCFAHDFDRGVRTTLDVAYGDHSLQRMDVFEGESTVNPATAGRAALVFVHGGGFVGGDKQSTDLFYRNVGVWAVRQGMVAFSINYRLAPAHRWPAGAEDVAAALAWIAAHAPRFHIDPRRIVLMGHSVGATHAAACIAAAHQANKPLPAAALAIVSGTYALEGVKLTPNRIAYFGDDPATVASRSSADAVLQSDLPVLIAVAGLDPQETLDQGTQLSLRMNAAGRSNVRFLNATEDNHFSTVLRLGAFDSAFASVLGEFIATAV